MRSRIFACGMDRLDEVAGRVAEVTRAAYPDLKIPVHGRFRHFDVGGVQRSRELDAALVPQSRAIARAPKSIS